MQTLTIRNRFEYLRRKIENDRLKEFEELAMTVNKEPIPQFIKDSNPPQDDENNE